jgi:uncharacterized protein (TIGR02145 family)
MLSLSFGTVTDIDGNVYETVQIGEQLWMAENLKVTHYKDGSEIPNITNNGDWVGLSTGAYCDYDNNSTNSETYGRLYNWYTVDDDEGVCPEGWHVPSDAEYTVITDYFGGYEVAGGKMKETGHEHWYYYSDEITEEATKESGFTGLPGGCRMNIAPYHVMGNNGYFWSSTNTWTRTLVYYDTLFIRYTGAERAGFSIRCLKD